MRRRALLAGSAAGLLAGDAASFAQQRCFDRMDCFSASPVSAAAAYTGPGDLVSGATAWYGLRAYSAAVAATGTQKAINIRRASDQATTDILILPNGNLDVATATTFCNATSGFITAWYDQSGNGNHAVQATPASQPQLVFSSIGGKPAVVFAGAQLLSGGSFTAFAAPVSMSAVVARTAAFTVGAVLTAGTGTVLEVLFANANQISIYNGAQLFVAATDSIAHAMQFLFNGASSVISVDGAETSGNAGTTNLAAAPIYIGARSTLMNLTGPIGEAGMWPVGFTAPNRAAMRANQKTYWATP